MFEKNIFLHLLYPKGIKLDSGNDAELNVQSVQCDD